jgi:hypothetical protein
MDEQHKRRIRSSKAKKEAAPRIVKRDNTDINDIKSWPPGTFMVFNNADTQAVTGGMAPRFIGLGIVVANDGMFHIRVVWGSNCKHQYLEYDVRTLNRNVIFHVA